MKDIDTAIALAVKVEHGNRHTAIMHSKNVDYMTRFAKAIETTIFVKNAPSYAGIGVGGEGGLSRLPLPDRQEKDSLHHVALPVKEDVFW